MIGHIFDDFSEFFPLEVLCGVRHALELKLDEAVGIIDEVLGELSREAGL